VIRDLKSLIDIDQLNLCKRKTKVSGTKYIVLRMRAGEKEYELDG